MTNKLKEDWENQIGTVYMGNAESEDEELLNDEVLAFIDKQLASQREEIRGKLEGKAFVPDFGDNHKWTGIPVKYLTLGTALSILQEMEGNDTLRI